MTLDDEFPIHINIVKKLNKNDEINVDKNLLYRFEKCKVINYIELTEEDMKQSDSEHENYVDTEFPRLILNLKLTLFRKQISGPTQIDYTVDLI